MNHCPMLEEIPKLPSSLRRIEAHGCGCLETLSSPTHLLLSSLLSCIKSLIQLHMPLIFSSFLYINRHGFTWHFVQNEEEDSCRQRDNDLVLPGSSSGNSDEEEDPLGQIDWVSHWNMGYEVSIELPVNWYEDNNFWDLLYFSTFFHLMMMIWRIKISLLKNIGASGVSSDPALRVTYFPHTAISEPYQSGRWKKLRAHLDTPFVSCHCGKNKAFKVESCGMHLIYAQDHHLQQNQNQWPQLSRENSSSRALIQRIIHNIKDQDIPSFFSLHQR
ncbi:hypothetical protein AAG906_000451 [Vitis piasezkii]